VIELLKGVWVFRRFFGYAVLLAIIGWLMFSKAGLKNDLLEQELANKQLSTLVDKQNDRIEAYESVAKKSAAAAEKALKEARVVEKFHANKATRILVSVPTNSDECIAALELLKEYQ
jgi:hypothetical protein